MFWSGILCEFKIFKPKFMTQIMFLFCFRLVSLVSVLYVIKIYLTIACHLTVLFQ